MNTPNLQNSVNINALLESLDDLVFELDKDGVIIQGWASEKNTFFIEPKKFIGKSLTELFPKELSSYFNDAIAKTYETGKIQQVEYQSPFDNRYFNARFNLLKTTDNIVVLVRDITQFHQIQSQIVISERRFRNLIKHSTDITTIISAEGNILYQSESFNRQFGYKDSVIGHNILEFVHPDDQAKVLNEIKLGIESGGVSDLIEFRFKHADGHYVDVESRGNNLLNEPGIEGIVVNTRDITDRKHAEEKLKQNEERYRNLLHNSMDIITVLNEKGEVMLDSFSILTQFGYDNTLEGTSIFDFVHPDDLEKAKLLFAESMKKPGITEPIEFRFKSADGSYRNVEAIGNNLFHEPSIHGFVINSRDITERKRMQSDLQMSNARTAAILESTSDVIFAIDTNYKYIAFNKAHEQIIKLVYGVDIHLGDKALLDENDLAKFDRVALKLLFDRSIKGEQFTHVFEVNSDNTNMRYTEISFNPIKNEQGSVVGVAVFSKDITERKRSADEILKARNEAIAAASAKSEFLSNMSHEIRTPMNAIIGMTELLLEKSSDDESKEYLQSIKYSSDNLLVVINDILDFSKIEAGKVALEQIDFNIRHKLDEIKKLFAFKSKEKELEFITEFDSNIPEYVNGDPYRLNQILFNLLGNAVKFTSKGSVIMKVSVIDGIDDDVRLLFEIKDSGIGIPDRKMESIFESFSQAYTDTTRKFGGTGLGLAITKKLVHLLGGKIYLTSKINVGSTFSVEIPYLKSTKISGLESIKVQSPVADRFLKGIHILVAEDNSINQFLIKQTLSKWDCEITMASNGQEALSLLKANDYNIVLMDLQMPEVNGYEATRIIRSKNTSVRNPTIPIIALTADAFPETKRKVLETGMNDFVAKPFNRDELFDKIARLCSRPF